MGGIALAFKRVWNKDVEKRGGFALREEAKPGGFAYLTRLNEVVVSVLFRNLTIWRTHDLPLSEKDKPNNALR
jgi:hypothetical protein